MLLPTYPRPVAAEKHHHADAAPRHPSLLYSTIASVTLLHPARPFAQSLSRFTGVSRPFTGSTARRASSNAITPSRQGSPSSPNMTGVGNSFPSSLIVVLPTSVGTTLPSASSDRAERSTGTSSRSSSSLGTVVKVEPVSTVTSSCSNLFPWGSPTPMLICTLPILPPQGPASFAFATFVEMWEVWHPASRQFSSQIIGSWASCSTGDRQRPAPNPSSSLRRQSQPRVGYGASQGSWTSCLRRARKRRPSNHGNPHLP